MNTVKCVKSKLALLSRPKPVATIVNTNQATRTIPVREIRASYNDETVRIYQAYSTLIAESAVQAGRFVSPPFKMGRMTWIKPSFLWMMYRSGWATKPGQERILAIDITRTGFERALAHAALSTFQPEQHISEEVWRSQMRTAQVRVQWDPERNLHLQRMAYRAIQIGLSGESVTRYVEDWIAAITDVTDTARTIASLIRKNRVQDAKKLLPAENVYHVNSKTARGLGMLGENYQETSC